MKWRADSSTLIYIKATNQYFIPFMISYIKAYKPDPILTKNFKKTKLRWIVWGKSTVLKGLGLVSVNIKFSTVRMSVNISWEDRLIDYYQWQLYYEGHAIVIDYKDLEFTWSITIHCFQTNFSPALHIYDGHTATVCKIWEHYLQNISDHRKISC